MATQSISPKVMRKRKFVRRVKAMPPAALRNELCAHIALGDDRQTRLSDIEGSGTFEAQTIAAHWYLDDDAWHIPSPNGGGRELVFTAYMGVVHPDSVVRQRCHETECVNPFHTDVMTRQEARERHRKTWERRVVSYENKVVKQGEYEAGLVDGTRKQQLLVRSRRLGISESPECRLPSDK